MADSSRSPLARPCVVDDAMRMHDASRSDFHTADVAVIGFGPVGATLAHLLGARGIRTIVLERESSVYHLPRAVHFDDEVMRVFETIGLSEEIGSRTLLSPGMRFVDSAGRELVDWSRPPTVTPQGWQPSYRFHQPDLEYELRRALKARSSVSIMSRCDVFALDEDDEGVKIRFEELANGRLGSVHAKYVVGCDGARSLVRRLMGAVLDDLGFHERWLVLDFILGRDRSDLGDFSVQYCDPVRPTTYVRGVGDRRRWEIALLDEEDSAVMTAPERIWPLLQRWVTPDDGKIERAAVYTFHSVVAQCWKSGRLLLAGDSAHQTPPFLGQGMCAGIRDASNLAWKLADVVQGRSDEALLSTYETERSPHVREYIQRAVALGGIINTKNAKQSLELLGRKNDEPVRFSSPKPKLGPGLWAKDDNLAGQLAPQPTLSNGIRLDHIVGYHYVLLAQAGAIDGKVLDFIRASQPELRLVDDTTPSLQKWLADNAIVAALVRPDRYILGTARNPGELSCLLTTLNKSTTGHSPLNQKKT